MNLNLYDASEAKKICQFCNGIYFFGAYLLNSKLGPKITSSLSQNQKLRIDNTLLGHFVCIF